MMRFTAGELLYAKKKEKKKLVPILYLNYDVTDYDNVNHPNDVPILFLDFDVIILDDVNHWAIVTSLNPCTPTPLRPMM